MKDKKRDKERGREKNREEQRRRETLGRRQGGMEGGREGGQEKVTSTDFDQVSIKLELRSSSLRSSIDQVMICVWYRRLSHI